MFIYWECGSRPVWQSVSHCPSKQSNPSDMSTHNQGFYNSMICIHTDRIWTNERWKCCYTRRECVSDLRGVQKQVIPRQRKVGTRRNEGTKVRYNRWLFLLIASVPLSTSTVKSIKDWKERRPEWFGDDVGMHHITHTWTEYWWRLILTASERARSYRMKFAVSGLIIQRHKTSNCYTIPGDERKRGIVRSSPASSNGRCLT